MRYRRWLLAILVLSLTARDALAQTYTAASDLLFYGDNTEFANPFRGGETTLGALGRVGLEVAFNDRVKLRGGFFGSGRYGSHEFLEQAEPVLALEIASRSQRFVFGSLDTIQTHHDVPGPDRETLHGLLPPLQRETLSFSRGQEMGLQWLVSAPRLTHDAWINWQRLNTANQRERFDAGYNASVGLVQGLHLNGQWHVVHEGGQQFDSGRVSDSQAFALGPEWSRHAGRFAVVLDSYAVATRTVPDREQPALTEAGLGVFARGAVSRGPWRAHTIVWRSRDTLKEEGDPNYLALRTDSRVFHKVRDYGEVGLTRRFSPAPGVDLYAAVRIHRTESHYEYSYRIVGRVRVRHQL